MAKRKSDSYWAFIAIASFDTLDGELIGVDCGSEPAARSYAEHLSRSQGRAVHWFRLEGVALAHVKETK